MYLLILFYLVASTTETPVATTSTAPPNYEWTEKDYLVSPNGIDDSSSSGRFSIGLTLFNKIDIHYRK